MTGFSSIQKCTAAMRMLECGAPADGQDDYMCMAEFTTIHSMYRFYGSVVAVLGPNYLKGPNEVETTRIMEQNAARGFIEMLGSIDYMQWS